VNIRALFLSVILQLAALAAAALMLQCGWNACAMAMAAAVILIGWSIGEKK